MRDPKRIDAFLKELGKYWKKVPDWRFGQFICNVFGTFSTDPFFPEEDEMLEMIGEFFNEEKKENEDK